MRWFLAKGLERFLKAANIKKLNTSGYHLQTNGKCKRFNGILEAALFRLNTTGDPAQWEDFLPAVLFSTRIHVSDSSGFSPFELTYGVKPRLAVDPAPVIATDAVLPGEAELKVRVQELNSRD